MTEPSLMYTRLRRYGKESQNGRPHFLERGRTRNGFTLLAKRTHRSFRPDQTGNSRVHETVDYEEITEFSEAPLTPDLFVPPPDFKRVRQLSEAVRTAVRYPLWFRWEMWKDLFALPDRIAKFKAGSPLY